MKMLLGFALLGASLGCQRAPVQCLSAPSPTPEELVQVRGLRTQVVPGGLVRGFPRVLADLMDQGYLITSANEPAGLIAFHQQWRDEAQGGALIRLEGSLLLKALGPESTQVRLLLSGSAQRRETTSWEPRNISMISTVQQHVAPEEYRKVLDLVAASLNPGQD